MGESRSFLIIKIIGISLNEDPTEMDEEVGEMLSSKFSSNSEDEIQNFGFAPNFWFLSIVLAV